jgi:peptidoglycan hydrolase-like protein with peptidoglycan-binding domain
MTDETENDHSNGKIRTSLTSVMIFAACGFVTWNVLFAQDTPIARPGATAVHVQVNDSDIANDPEPIGKTSIGDLVDQSNSSLSPSGIDGLISLVQSELTLLGYYQGEIDGQMGPQTRQAVKLYQDQNGLSSDGVLSGKLLEHLRYTRKLSEASDNTGSINQVLDVDRRIRKAQERLILFGYNPGKPDGVLGKATINAIRQFQADRGVAVTGKLTDALLAELGV